MECILVSSGVSVRRPLLPWIDVTLASPLAVIVVGKNIVVPFGFRFGDKLGDTMKGDILPIFVMSSKNEVPFAKGEFTRVALVGNP